MQKNNILLFFVILVSLFLFLHLFTSLIVASSASKLTEGLKAPVLNCMPKHILIFRMISILGIFLLFILKFNKGVFLWVPTSLILSGGLYNVYQSKVLGCVTDYFNIYFLHFNLADIFIWIGVFWLFVVFFTSELLRRHF